MTAEADQQRIEAAIWADLTKAVKRDDMKAATCLWNLYVSVHAKRPKQMVERLEQERGLA